MSLRTLVKSPIFKLTPLLTDPAEPASALRRAGRSLPNAGINVPVKFISHVAQHTHLLETQRSMQCYTRSVGQSDYANHFANSFFRRRRDRRRIQQLPQTLSNRVWGQAHGGFDRAAICRARAECAVIGVTDNPPRDFTHQPAMRLQHPLNP